MKDSFKDVSISSSAPKTGEMFLQELEDARREKILQFHEIHRAEIESSWGSKSKHQAWPGGYMDHLTETFRMVETMYEGLSKLHPLPFSRDSAIIVLYYHDVEKIWKYTVGLPKDFDKGTFLFETLATDYKIKFSPAEVNALRYIHGEPEAEYNPDTRLMGPLAAFCHSIDTMSARMWHHEGQGLG
ncbi:MAG: hypothetical protein AAF821_05000 [Cyanobacteria bacterium P01_D01_bin.156]